jgi:isopentenyl diphosphate isomerase/L-lactate dehydrogenase-like FMN-dependent dehydrogenase
VSTSSRKLDHIRICLDRAVESEIRPFDDLVLVHRALPEMDEAEIDTSCSFLGRRLKAPIIITSPAAIPTPRRSTFAWRRQRRRWALHSALALRGRLLRTQDRLRPSL